ncbi:MAG TPA: hypothetical protein VMM18_09235 [Gemmatimonadaceae bacterium]|nr:hypothetical protein [Gemmatimonadaceae bacterium]
MSSRALVAVLLLPILAGCATPLQPHARAPVPEWVGTVTEAQSAAAEGEFLRADSALVAYEQANPGTPEATEAVYWRGIFALDPSNPHGSAAVAAAAFEAYLRDPAAVLRRSEAAVFHRLASRLDSLATGVAISAASVPPPAGVGAARSNADPRDEELRRLREELRRANEELERIRRRLATPARPDPPPP